LRIARENKVIFNRKGGKFLSFFVLPLRCFHPCGQNLPKNKNSQPPTKGQNSLREALKETKLYSSQPSRYWDGISKNWEKFSLAWKVQKFFHYKKKYKSFYDNNDNNFWFGFS